MIGSKVVLSNEDLVSTMLEGFKMLGVSFEDSSSVPSRFEEFMATMGIFPDMCTKLRKAHKHEQQFFEMHSALIGYGGVLLAMAKLPKSPRQFMPILNVLKALAEGILELFVLNLLDEFSAKDGEDKYVPTMLTDERGDVYWYKTPFMPELLKMERESGKATQ